MADPITSSTLSRIRTVGRSAFSCACVVGSAVLSKLGLAATRLQYLLSAATAIIQLRSIAHPRRVAAKPLSHVCIIVGYSSAMPRIVQPMCHAIAPVDVDSTSAPVDASTPETPTGRPAP
jgi:hypothetical protein